MSKGYPTHIKILTDNTGSASFECECCRMYLGEERILGMMRQREKPACPYCQSEFASLLFMHNAKWSKRPKHAVYEYLESVKW